MAGCSIGGRRRAVDFRLLGFCTRCRISGPGSGPPGPLEPCVGSIGAASKLPVSVIAHRRAPTGNSERR
jgi:hypothetical protein